jgi:RNA polymerase sigma factor for flagellar operon FliA
MPRTPRRGPQTIDALRAESNAEPQSIFDSRAFTEIEHAISSEATPPECKTNADLALSAEHEQLVIEHVPVVRFIARQIHKRLPQHVPIEDLYGAGVVGLLEALDRFIPSKQVEFRSYAQFRIRGSILDSLRESDWGSRGMRRKARDIERTIETLTARLNRPPSDREIAQEMNTHLAAYQKLQSNLKGLEVASLDPADLIDVPSRHEDDPLFRFLNSELRERLAEAISKLRDQERQVLTLYYYEDLKQKEIASLLGLGDSRISQILNSAVIHLRRQLAGLATPQ